MTDIPCIFCNGDCPHDITDINRLCLEWVGFNALIIELLIRLNSVNYLMAAKNTVVMIDALADERRLRIFEILAECDRSDRKLSEMVGISVEEVREQVSVMERAGLVISAENDDHLDYCLDPQQVAVLTGFFELMLNKCSPPKCC